MRRALVNSEQLIARTRHKIVVKVDPLYALSVIENKSPCLPKKATATVLMNLKATVFCVLNRDASCVIHVRSIAERFGSARLTGSENFSRGSAKRLAIGIHHEHWRSDVALDGASCSYLEMNLREALKIIVRT